MNIIERINEEVSIYDLFDIADPPVKYLTKVKPSQISCPFHGQDNRPSARVYPDTNSFRCFFCSKSWNPVSFWAEDNQWFRDDDKLDIGRAIEDLSSRYNITISTFDWQKKFYALKKKDEDSKVISSVERRDLRTYYAWEISNIIDNLTKENRGIVRDNVLELWKDLDNTDLNIDSWESNLKNWYKCAKIKLNVEQV